MVSRQLLRTIPLTTAAVAVVRLCASAVFSLLGPFAIAISLLQDTTALRLIFMPLKPIWLKCLVFLKF